jgi:hypothetical protein
MSVENRQLHLLPKEAAERLRVSVKTLESWRCTGGGPRYAKFGKRVLYPLAELEAWEKSRLRDNTMQFPNEA